MQSTGSLKYPVVVHLKLLGVVGFLVVVVVVVVTVNGFVIAPVPVPRQDFKAEMSANLVPHFPKKSSVSIDQNIPPARPLVLIKLH